MIKTIFENRKELIKAVAEFANGEAQYMGAPTFAYKVGEYMIAKDGTVTAEIDTDNLREFLVERGFAEAESNIEFTIPLNGADRETIVNFVNTLYSRQYLLNQAMKMAVLEISEEFIVRLADKEISDVDFGKVKGFSINSENIIFKCESPKDGDLIKAYMTVMCMAFKRAKEKKFVRTRLVKPRNEKYYMRIWLISLGLGGKGGAETRKSMLKNLKGNSAFRTEEEIARARERLKNRN